MRGSQNDTEEGCLVTVDADLFFEGPRDYVHSTRLLHEFLRLLKDHLINIDGEIKLEQLKVTQKIVHSGKLYLYHSSDVDNVIREAGTSECRFSWGGQKFVAVFVEGGNGLETKSGGWEQSIVNNFNYTGNYSGNALVKNLDNGVDLLRAIIEIHKQSIITYCIKEGGYRKAPNVRFVYIKNLNLLNDTDLIGKEFEVSVDTISTREMDNKVYTSARIILPSDLQKAVGNICFYYD